MLVTCPYVDNRLEINFQHIQFDLTGNQEKDILEVNQKITSALEKVISHYPEQYFWMHRRWRARPPEDPEKYIKNIIEKIKIMNSRKLYIHTENWVREPILNFKKLRG